MYLLIILVLFSFTSLVLAQPNSSPKKSKAKSSTNVDLSNASRDEAILLMRKGQKHFTQAKYTEAIESWRQAYSLFPDNKLLYYIASTYERIPKACIDEDRAWRAYFGGCEVASCYHREGALERNKKFKRRCYVKVRFISNAPQATLKVLERTYPLPHQTSLLRKRYQDFKVSAPHYISEQLDFDLASLPQKSHQHEINTTLIVIPKLTFFEEHKWKITGGSLLAGVALMSLGSLQLSSAKALNDQTQRDFAMLGEFTNEEERRAYNYDSKLSEFESKRFWGASMLTLGSMLVGAGVWSFFHRNSQRMLIERARQQGDLTHTTIEYERRWSLEPLRYGGAQWSFEAEF